MKYNEEHGITPQTIQKAVRNLISISKEIEQEQMRFEKDPESMSKDEIVKLTEELRAKRTASQPLDVPSAGSTFKRPEGYFAARLIEEAGLKGFALDDSGAQVSPKHAGFVVNNGGRAKASDVKKLIDHVAEKVYENSGVRLETEVRLIGEFER